MTNWDTNELYLWIINTEKWYTDMQKWSRTAKEFKYHAQKYIAIINEQVSVEMNINPVNICWNELYLDFCNLIENENPKMNLSGGV